MEDLILYGVGALAVRGARRMVLGPSREARLAEQVEQLSSQVAEQARMIQQLQTQALTPHANQAGQPSAQEPVAHPARSAARQDPEQAAVRPSRTGIHSGKRSSEAGRAPFRAAKRARLAAPGPAVPAGGNASPSSTGDDESPSDPGPAERGLSAPMPRPEAAASASENTSSSESEDDPSSSEEATSGSSGSNSDEPSSSESEQNLPAPPQRLRALTDSSPEPSRTSDSSGGSSAALAQLAEAQARMAEARRAEATQSPSGPSSSESEESSSSESEAEPPAAASPASSEPSNSSLDSEPEGTAATQASSEPSESSSQPFSSESEESGSSSDLQEADSDLEAVSSKSEQHGTEQADLSTRADSGSQLQEGEPAGGSEDADDQPASPSRSNQSPGSMHGVFSGEQGAGHRSGSENASPAEEDSQVQPEGGTGDCKDACEMEDCNEGASVVSQDPTSSEGQRLSSTSEQPAPVSVPHVSGTGTEGPSPTVGEMGGSADCPPAESDQHVAATTKRSRDADADGPALPQPKRLRSVFQRCASALTGWLLGTPGTACSAAGAPATSSVGASEQQEMPSFQELHRPVHAGASVAVHAEEGSGHAETGHQAYRAAEDGFERAVSEAQAAGAAACEAAHAAQPIATGVFAEEEVPMDDAFLSELDRLFQTDDRLRPADTSQSPAQANVTHAGVPDSPLPVTCPSSQQLPSEARKQAPAAAATIATGAGQGLRSVFRNYQDWRARCGMPERNAISGMPGSAFTSYGRGVIASGSLGRSIRQSSQPGLRSNGRLPAGRSRSPSPAWQARAFSSAEQDASGMGGGSRQRSLSPERRGIPRYPFDSPLDDPDSPRKSLDNPIGRPDSPLESPDSPPRYPDSPNGYPESPPRYPDSPRGYPGSPNSYPESPNVYPDSPLRYPDSPLQYSPPTRYSPESCPGNPPRYLDSPLQYSPHGCPDSSPREPGCLPMFPEPLDGYPLISPPRDADMASASRSYDPRRGRSCSRSPTPGWHSLRSPALRPSEYSPSASRSPSPRRSARSPDSSSRHRSPCSPAQEPARAHQCGQGHELSGSPSLDGHAHCSRHCWDDVDAPYTPQDLPYCRSLSRGGWQYTPQCPFYGMNLSPGARSYSPQPAPYGRSLSPGGRRRSYTPPSYAERRGLDSRSTSPGFASTPQAPRHGLGEAFSPGPFGQQQPSSPTPEVSPIEQTQGFCRPSPPVRFSMSRSRSRSAGFSPSLSRSPSPRRPASRSPSPPARQLSPGARPPQWSTSPSRSRSGSEDPSGSPRQPGSQPGSNEAALAGRTFAPASPEQELDRQLPHEPSSERSPSERAAGDASAALRSRASSSYLEGRYPDAWNCRVQHARRDLGARSRSCSPPRRWGSSPAVTHSDHPLHDGPDALRSMSPAAAVSPLAASPSQSPITASSGDRSPIAEGIVETPSTPKGRSSDAGQQCDLMQGVAGSFAQQMWPSRQTGRHNVSGPRIISRIKSPSRVAHKSGSARNDSGMARQAGSPVRNGTPSRASPTASQSGHSHSSGSPGLQPGEGAQAQRSPGPVSGQVSAQARSSQARSGSQRSSHGRRRCGHLGALAQRVRRRFIGAWRSRHSRGRSHGRGGASSAAEAIASADPEVAEAVHDEGGAAVAAPVAVPMAAASLRHVEQSPQLRAPPGRARGIALRSLSPISGIESPLNSGHPDGNTARSSQAFKCAAGASSLRWHGSRGGSVKKHGHKSRMAKPHFHGGRDSSDSLKYQPGSSAAAHVGSRVCNLTGREESDDSAQERSDRKEESIVDLTLSD